MFTRIAERTIIFEIGKVELLDRLPNLLAGFAKQDDCTASLGVEGGGSVLDSLLYKPGVDMCVRQVSLGHDSSRSLIYSTILLSGTLASAFNP